MHFHVATTRTFQAATAARLCSELQVTYAMVKPDAVAAGKVQDVVDTIAASGLQVMQRKEMKLSADQVRIRANIE